MYNYGVTQLIISLVRHLSIMSEMEIERKKGKKVLWLVADMFKETTLFQKLVRFNVSDYIEIQCIRLSGLKHV